jgi:hypothetical protein
MSNNLNHIDLMNNFVALSKCLPGLTGIVEPDEEKPEHQLILDLRHRIIASMNKLLDDMGLPVSAKTESVLAPETNAVVSKLLEIFVRETRQLRDSIIARVPTENIAEIKTAADAFIRRVGEQFEAECFQRSTEKNLRAQEKSVRRLGEQTRAHASDDDLRAALGDQIEKFKQYCAGLGKACKEKDIVALLAEVRKQCNVAEPAPHV